MESLRISATGDRFHVEGFPNAVKVAKIVGEKAHKLGDLALHALDLRFAADCLAAINEGPTDFMQDVLWRSAILHYTKCFSSGVRRALKQGPIYKDEVPEALEAWKWFLDLRNKHVAHDVSAFNTTEVGAVVNDPTESHKIAKVACAIFRVVTLDNGAFGNLDLLIRRAREWVDLEQDQLCDAITVDLEKENHESLMRRPNLQYNPPASILQGRPGTPATDLGGPALG
jgi:hypothetical protein